MLFDAPIVIVHCCPISGGEIHRRTFPNSETSVLFHILTKLVNTDWITGTNYLFLRLNTTRGCDMLSWEDFSSGRNTCLTLPGVTQNHVPTRFIHRHCCDNSYNR